MDEGRRMTDELKGQGIKEKRPSSFRPSSAVSAFSARLSE
jgi:hypothetical protein